MSPEQATRRLVDPFPGSATRESIMTAVQDLLTDYEQRGIRGELWLDGSLLTQKEDPEDGDLTLVFSPGCETLLPSNLVSGLTEVGGVRLDGPLHAFGVFELPKGHPLEFLNKQSKDFWYNWWTHDREGTPKGMVVLKLAGGTP